MLKPVLPILLCVLVYTKLCAAEPGREVVYLTEHSMPGIFLDAESKPAGPTVELVKELSRRMEQSGYYYLMPWARAMQRAQQTPRSILFETVRNAEREALFKWVGPVKFYDMYLYGPSDIAGLGLTAAELSQRYIACGYRGASYHAALETMGFDDEKNLVLMTRAGDCIQMLKLGRAELTPLNRLRYGERFSAFGVELAPLHPIRNVELYLAFSLDFSDEEIQRWQYQLDQMFLDGSVRRLYQQDFPEELINRLEQAAAKSLQRRGAN